MGVADGEAVQGIEITIFMRLSMKYQLLKGKTRQHAGPPRAISDWSEISGAICVDVPSPYMFLLYCFCLFPKRMATTSFCHVTSGNGATF